MKITLKQFLLIPVLIAILISLYLSAAHKSKAKEALAIAVSPDGSTIATRGSHGMDLYDRESGRRKAGISGYLSYPYLSEHKPTLRFINDDTIVLSRKDWGMTDLCHFSLPAGEIVKSFGLVDNPAHDREHFLDKQRMSRVTMNLGGTNWRAQFYNLDDGSKLNASFKTVGCIRNISTSNDGSVAAIFVDNLNIDKTVLLDTVSGEIIGELPPAMNSQFSPDGSLLLQRHFGKIQMVDTKNGKLAWSMEFHCDQGSLSPDGKSVFLLQSWTCRLLELDARTGAVIKDESLSSHLAEGDRIACFDFADGGKTIVFATQNADRGFLSYDVRTASVSSFGDYPRLGLAVLFSVAIVLWSGAWCWITLMNRRDDPTKVNRLSFAMYRLLVVGGVIAIFWTVMPMFYDISVVIPAAFRFQPPKFLETIRLGLASIGIAAGVMAMTRGILRSNSWLRTTAFLQTLNLVNLDFINGIMGRRILNSFKHQN